MIRLRLYKRTNSGTFFTGITNVYWLEYISTFDHVNATVAANLIETAFYQGNRADKGSLLHWVKK